MTLASSKRNVSRETSKDDVPALRVKMRALSKIVPYPNNPRTHPPAQVTMLAHLIKKYGPDQSIVVDGDPGPEIGMILKGHGRRLAAIEAGRKDFPIVERFGMTAVEKRAMRIEDNQVGLLSGWDTTLMSMEVGSLKLAGYDISLLGFGEQQLVQFTTQPSPPGEFPTFGDNIPTDFECPQCHYKWSGKPTPGSDGDRPAPKVKTTKKKKKKANGKAKAAKKSQREAIHP